MITSKGLILRTLKINIINPSDYQYYKSKGSRNPREYQNYKLGGLILPNLRINIINPRD